MPTSPNLNLNSAWVIDRLLEQDNEITLYGDYVRALVTDISTPFDDVVLVSNKADILLELPILCQQRRGNVNPKGRNAVQLKLESFGRLYLVAAETTEDVSEMSDEDSDYLRPQDLLLLDAPKAIINDISSTIRNIIVNPYIEDTLSVSYIQDLTRAIYSYIMSDLRFTIIISKIPAVEYCKEMALLDVGRRSNIHTATMSKGEVFASDDVIEAFKTKVVHLPRTIGEDCLEEKKLMAIHNVDNSWIFKRKEDQILEHATVY